MADFPVQGASENVWGTMLIDFFKQEFSLSGAKGGSFTIVCNENQVVCNKNQVVVNWTGD